MATTAEQVADFYNAQANKRNSTPSTTTSERRRPTRKNTTRIERCNAASPTAAHTVSLFSSHPIPQKSTHMPPRDVAFPRNSRLHFIGSWRARYEAFLDAGVDDDDVSSPPRVVMHVDMDCFFAACATRDRPDLANVPVAVSWGTRGEISSCNYEARRSGVAAGQGVFTATTKCPDLVVVPYDFETIERVGLEVYEILFEASKGRCVGVSVDEAFLDADAAAGEPKTRIRTRINARRRCARKCTRKLGARVR